MDGKSDAHPAAAFSTGDTMLNILGRLPEHGSASCQHGSVIRHPAKWMKLVKSFLRAPKK